jgi:hypothetical protein
MLFKKIGHFNIIKNNKNILKKLYKFKKSFYIKKNNKFIKIKSRPIVNKGGVNNNCGLRYDGKSSRDLDEFMKYWMTKPANVAWSKGQDGYYIKRDYIKPINKTDKRCTDKDNHIHIFECYIWQNRETGNYSIDIGYSQKNRGVPIIVDFDEMNSSAHPNFLLNVKGIERNYRFIGRSKNRKRLFMMASFFFRRVFKETEYYNR